MSHHTLFQPISAATRPRLWTANFDGFASVYRELEGRASSQLPILGDTGQLVGIVSQPDLFLNALARELGRHCGT